MGGTNDPMSSRKKGRSDQGRKDDVESRAGWLAANGPILGIGVALVICVWVAFYPALDNDFVSWDDPTYVLERPEVLRPDDEGSSALWRTPVSLNYHPITMATLVWNSRQAARPHPGDPPDALPFIRTNIWLHALNTLLVLLFIHRLTRDVGIAAFCAAVFALHPMHVESVAWVSERKDVLYAFFLLAGLLTWSAWTRSRKAIWYVITVLLFTASCLSKAMAVIFPVLLVLIDFWEQRPLRAWRPWLEKAPLFVIALLIGLMAVDVQKGGDFHGLLHVDRALGTTAAVAGALPHSAMDQVRFGAYGYVMYLLRFLFPAGFSTFHPYPAAEARGLLFSAGPFILLAVVALSIWSLRKGRVVFFGMAFFTICVALVLQFLPVGRAVMAERYTYLAYIGLSFVLASGIAHWIGDRPSAARIWSGIVAAIILLFIPLTRAQVEVWQNTRTLFQQVIERYPKDPDAYADLGSWYGKRSGQEHAPALLDSAGMILAQGVNAGASSGPLFEALATYYGSKGLADSALVWFDRAVATGPVTGQLMHNRAMARYSKDPQGCLADIDRAIQLGHSHVGASYAMRARVHYRLTGYPAALQDITTAIEHFDQRTADAYLLRAYCHHQLGHNAEAEADARTVLRLDPNSAQAKELLRVLDG